MTFQTYNYYGSLSFDSVQVLFETNEDRDKFAKTERVEGIQSFLMGFYNNEAIDRKNEFYDRKIMIADCKFSNIYRYIAKYPGVYFSAVDFMGEYNRVNL